MRDMRSSLALCAAAGFLTAALTGHCGAPPAAEAPVEKQPPEKIAAKARAEVTFSVGTGQKGATVGLTRVQRNGEELPPPANMKLDRDTGAFSWLPTESQAGDFEVTFLVKDAAGESSRVTRHITVETPPIVPPNDKSEIARLLRQWDKEGTAAGNTGDFYDNRDGAHSLLRTDPYPQLDKVEYTEEQKKQRLHWALQLHLLYSHVTFGNSSTASGDMRWGSNPRRALHSQDAMNLLYRQYTRNHLYIYPEHRDHDPGRSGRGGGHGDVFPANTPYVIISQGSSGSDQPFMRAVPYALAAFRPEVKKLLVEKGLLMPTVQMVFRSSNKNLEKPDDYLTGKAHPTVFEGHNVDALKMVQTAHAIARDAVPPMIQLAVFEEDLALAGRDYFDPGYQERLFDTPAAIARIIRSTRQVHRMVVSAKASVDVNGRPLKFHWVVLRGDAARIQIKPLEQDGSRVELLVPHHERRPILPGSPLESSRVDIGAFAHNGAHYSAPGFISLYYLDNEARTYAPDGRVLEVAYDYGDSTIGYSSDRVLARDAGYDVTDWPALLALVGDEAARNEPMQFAKGQTATGWPPAGGGFAAQLLRKRFAPAELAALSQAAKELEAATATEKEPQKEVDEAEAARKKAHDARNDAKTKLAEAKKADAKESTDATKKAVDELEASLKPLEEERKKADDRWNAARQKLQEAQKAAHGVLTTSRPALAARGEPMQFDPVKLPPTGPPVGGGSVKDRLEKALNAIKDDATLYFGNAETIHTLHAALGDEGRKKAFVDERARLVKLGIVKEEGQGQFRLSPVLAGPEPPAERLTTFERNRLEWFHIAILKNVLYPGLLNRSYACNFVNPILTVPKDWRDVYHYDPKGHRGSPRADAVRPGELQPTGPPVGIGWTRHDAKGQTEFTADGARVLKKDALGRPIEARTVEYTIEGDRARPKGLKQQPGDTIRHYAYASDDDRVGRIEREERAAP